MGEWENRRIWENLADREQFGVSRCFAGEERITTIPMIPTT